MENPEHRYKWIEHKLVLLQRDGEVSMISPYLIRSENIKKYNSHRKELGIRSSASITALPAQSTALVLGNAVLSFPRTFLS